ncbi:hypothetical protein ACFY7H_03080 [Streptomyces sp. NPDC012794]|uniref:hypothetical protein n=1 Tax=Streptomyces sp. NPDC012794 TaxID=3364850 RepID=UPI003685269A
MSESFPQPEQPEQPTRAAEPARPAQQPAKSPRQGLGAAVTRGAAARWALGVGAVAVIVGGGVGGGGGGGGGGARRPPPPPHDDHGDRAAARHLVRSEPGREHALKGGPKAVREGAGPARGGFAKHDPAAPVPLPALPIGQAAEKAAAAVEGGKVAGLRAVAQEGGGSAWLAVVLGPDGVRHAVTVSGSDGSITSNVPRNHR